MLLLKHKDKLKSALPTILIVILLVFITRMIPSEDIEKFVRNTGPLAPVVYIFLSLLCYVVAPLSATPVSFVGFHIFGSSVAFLNSIAAFISFTINFWIARKWGRNTVRKMAGDDAIKTVDKYISEKGYISLFIVRVFLATYHDFISYAFGLTKIKYAPYLIISTLGLIPSYAITYWLAEQSSSALTFTIHSTIWAGIFITGYWFWYTKVRKKKKE